MSYTCINKEINKMWQKKKKKLSYDFKDLVANLVSLNSGIFKIFKFTKYSLQCKLK